MFLTGRGYINVFEEYTREKNILFKLEKLLQTNEERPYKEVFMISTTREELEVIISKFKTSED